MSAVLRSISQQAAEPDKACTEIDPNIMFPDNEFDVMEAKDVCLGCGFRDACLEGAMARREEFGIWGGTTPNERAALRRRQSRRSLREYGQYGLPLEGVG